MRILKWDNARNSPKVLYNNGQMKIFILNCEEFNFIKDKNIDTENINLKMLSVCERNGILSLVLCRYVLQEIISICVKSTLMPMFKHNTSRNSWLIFG